MCYSWDALFVGCVSRVFLLPPWAVFIEFAGSLAGRRRHRLAAPSERLIPGRGAKPPGISVCSLAGICVALRTVTYTTARIWGFLYFYDWIIPDSRRQARADFYGYAGLAGGLVGGFLSNPVELVFRRMQVDEMYPERARRNYKSFIDGLVKVSDEGALFRGSLAHGLKFAGLVSVAAGCYDWMKENMFYFFGPITLNRLVGTAVGAGVAAAISMPFDTVATRLHTMRPLPNGVMPYENTLDCFAKMIKYECNFEK